MEDAEPLLEIVASIIQGAEKGLETIPFFFRLAGVLRPALGK